jgi:DNA-binding XRE family transcriptional regulator
MALTDIEAQTLESLGRRLRQQRLELGLSQQLLAERIGVSPKTLRAMEQGAEGTSLGNWVAALSALRRLEDLEGVLAVRESLEARFRAQKTAQARQRAPRRSREERARP